MEAKHILRQVEGCIFDLLNSGETEVVFGERLGESFNVYVKDGNTVEVSYGGNSVKVSLPSAINRIKENLLARYIMQGFARIYLNKNESKNMNRKIRITEGALRKIVNESVKKVLKETRDRFDDEAYEKWCEEEQIPQRIKNMVNHIAEKIGISAPFEGSEEEVIKLKNRGGYTYGYAKGFTLSHCTSSYADGPGEDYSKEFIDWIKGLGFAIENSYGDNGMDYTTNWQDTYWHYDFIYKPSTVDYEQFMIWGDEDYDY